MKLSKALFDDPRAARNVASAMHEAPRESRAWIGWLLLGVIAGGGVVDVWHMYEERLVRDDRGVSQSQSSGQEIPTTGAPR